MLVERTKMPTSANLAWRLQHKPRLNLVWINACINLKIIASNLHLGMIKPPNSNTSNTVKLPAVVETTIFRHSDATKRNMDTELQCTANSKIKCRKNLQTQMIKGGTLLRKEKREKENQATQEQNQSKLFQFKLTSLAQGCIQ